VFVCAVHKQSGAGCSCLACTLLTLHMCICSTAGVQHYVSIPCELLQLQLLLLLQHAPPTTATVTTSIVEAVMSTLTEISTLLNY
jgi:hypothetical protein